MKYQIKLNLDGECVLLEGGNYDYCLKMMLWYNAHKTFFNGKFSIEPKVDSIKEDAKFEIRLNSHGDYQVICEGDLAYCSMMMGCLPDDKKSESGIFSIVEVEEGEER